MKKMLYLPNLSASFFNLVLLFILLFGFTSPAYSQKEVVIHSRTTQDTVLAQKYKWVKKYDEVVLSEGVFICRKYIRTPHLKDNDTIFYRNSWRAYLCNEKGHRITDNYYDNIDSFHDGIARVVKSKRGTAYLFDYQGLKGFINKKGEIVIPIMYPYVSNFSEGLAAVYDSTQSSYFIDKSNKKIFSEKRFKYVNDFYKGIAYVKLSNNSSNYIDHSGNFLMPGKFDFIESRGKYSFMEDTLQIVRKGNKYGLLGDSLELAVPLIYDLIDTNRFERFNHLSKIQLTNKVGFVDTFDGKIIIPLTYTEFKKSENSNFIWARSDEGWGLINASNKVLVPFVYTDVIEALKDYSIVKDKKTGIVNNQGVLMVPCIYDKVSPFYNGIAIVIADGKVGYVDQTGKVLIKPYYEKGSYFVDDVATVETKLMKYKINSKNQHLTKSLNSTGIWVVLVLSSLLVLGAYKTSSVFVKRPSLTV
ncbi:hypothetical protein BWI93_16410 [Siphonobacter sp. BAB-5385]|uniref:WG repeat-containing protein n=1 Tax=Siphonobacter sp. BAB-5385 TaxID=1864822 RepID=UPI000B9EAC4C|nr:WG repeat-containing protein [Siphonobacter sp. BAB-5385]OZI07109.1 hypothetical protein BWI93_16410 [Siphonobacter sp. BAB-5385]